MNPIDDIMAVVAKAQDDASEPKGDVRYFFVSAHREYIEKIVVTGYEGPSKEEATAVRGYVYNNPHTEVRVLLPYPMFETLKELKEHYRKFFE